MPTNNQAITDEELKKKKEEALKKALEVELPDLVQTAEILKKLEERSDENLERLNKKDDDK